jgi:hypothetical protein
MMLQKVERPGTTMRKLATWGVLFLAAMLLCGSVFLLAGCGDDNGATESSETTLGSNTTMGLGITTDGSTDGTTGGGPGSTGPTSTMMIVLGDYALWDQAMKYESVDGKTAVVMTVFAPEEIEDAGGMADQAANKLVAVQVKLDNIGEAGIKVNPAWFKLKDADAVACQPIEVDGVEFEALESGELDSGDAVNGYLFFELPDEGIVTSVTCDVSMGAEAGALRTWSE